MHWKLCGKAKLEWADRWYKHLQVVKNTGFKVLWDFNVQCDRMDEARRPDIIFGNGGQDNQHAICGDVQVKDKKLEKIEKYQLLCEEIGKLWKLTKVTVVPIVNGTSVAVSDMFEEYMGKLNFTNRIEVIHKTAL